MEKELIKITETNGQRAVNARELHQVLGVGRDFSTWIKQRINKYGFVEGTDFQRLPQMGETGLGIQKTVEYALSMDMAKELAMVENSDAGRKVRQYFIECEHQLNQPQLMSKAQLILKQAQMLVDIETRQQENERRTLAIEQRLNKLDEERQQATHLLLEAPLSQDEVPQMSERMLTRKLVNEYSKATNIKQDKVWESLYSKLFYVYKKNINAYQRMKTDKSKLDIAERNGLVKYLYAIISNMIASLRKS